MENTQKDILSVSKKFGQTKLNRKTWSEPTIEYIAKDDIHSGITAGPTEGVSNGLGSPYSAS